jgi:hypothetical protein
MSSQLGHRNYGLQFFYKNTLIKQRTQEAWSRLVFLFILALKSSL